MASITDPEGVETRIIHRLIDFRRKDVLEIGCGDGRLTWRFADHAKSVTAIDPDEVTIAAAQKNPPPELRSIVSFRVADIADIHLPLGNYNVAVFSGSL